jgi:hypothetical protein
MQILFSPMIIKYGVIYSFLASSQLDDSLGRYPYRCENCKKKVRLPFRQKKRKHPDALYARNYFKGSANTSHQSFETRVARPTRGCPASARAVWREGEISSRFPPFPVAIFTADLLSPAPSGLGMAP